MVWSEILFGWSLVALLVGLAGFVGRRQLRNLRELRTANLPDEELGYERRKARRRLVSAGLLLFLGVLLIVQMAVYEPVAGALAEERKQFGAEDAPRLTDEQKVFLRVWGGVWIAFLLALLAALVLAGLDLMATRRYGLKQYRKIQADRRAMIQRQAARLRQEREEET